MKHYLVIILFIFSFLANSSGMASLFFATHQTASTQPLLVAQPNEPLPMAAASEHCHQASATQELSTHGDGCVGGVCDNCFTHCGGALLSAEFPNLIAPPSFFVSRQTHFYTPLLNTSFLRPPQAAVYLS